MMHRPKYCVGGQWRDVVTLHCTSRCNHISMIERDKCASEFKESQIVLAGCCNAQLWQLHIQSTLSADLSSRR